MAIKLPAKVLEFANGKTELYELFADYWNHYRSLNDKSGKKYEYDTVDSDGKLITFAQKEDALNALIRKEIYRKANVTNPEDFPVEQWASHPTLNWVAFALINSLIDAVLPDTIIDSLGVYTDVRTIGYGDTAVFDVESRDLFTVAKVGRGVREGEIKKQYRGQVTLNPEPRILSVGVSLYRVLAGKESLAYFVTKAIRSLETEMAADTYATFAAAMDALPTASPVLKVVGYTQESLIGLGQLVQAANGGNKPMIVGTQLALAKILPSNSNFRFMLDSEYVKMGYVRDFMGFETLMLPQVLDWSNYTTKLADNRLWVVSPSAQKLVKLVIEGSTLSYQSGTFDHATLTQNSTLYKSWVSGVASSAIAGVVTLA